jgi:hypothetical protein
LAGLVTAGIHYITLDTKCKFTYDEATRTIKIYTLVDQKNIIAEGVGE